MKLRLAEVLTGRKLYSMKLEFGIGHILFFFHLMFCSLYNQTNGGPVFKEIALYALAAVANGILETK